MKIYGNDQNVKYTPDTSPHSNFNPHRDYGSSLHQ